jgi:hypothetical protein
MNPDWELVLLGELGEFKNGKGDNEQRENCLMRIFIICTHEILLG